MTDVRRQERFGNGALPLLFPNHRRNLRERRESGRHSDGLCKFVSMAEIAIVR